MEWRNRSKNGEFAQGMIKIVEGMVEIAVLIKYNGLIQRIRELLSMKEMQEIRWLLSMQL